MPTLRLLGALHSVWTIERSMLTIAAATLLGLLLRGAATRGDLGLDEVWSLHLVATIHSIGDVFWGISHDNNHFLNSAWLFAMGPDRPAWIYRWPAVIIGTLAVPAVARWLGRESPAAGVIGAMLAAIALPLVDFGSEARGYAGLALATVLAMDECGRATDAALAPIPNRARLGRAAWRLGAAVGFGALSHLAMTSTVAVLGLATLARIGSTTRRLAPTVMMTGRIFLPSALLALPAALAVLAGIASRGRLTIGDVDPFSISKLVQGFGEMLLLTSGLPDALPAAAGIAAALLLLLGAARFRLVSKNVLALAVASLILLPVAMAAARLPNVGYARYFAVCGIGLLAVQAAVLGRLWQASGAGRRWVVVGLVILTAGGMTQDGLLIRDGRGGFSETLAVMQAEGTGSYAASRPTMALMLLEAAERSSRWPTAQVSDATFCRAKPDWYIAVGVYDPRPDAIITVGPASCPASYKVRAPFQASPLSGTQWTLYRRN